MSAGLSISGVFELGPIRDTYLNDKMQFTEDELVTLSPLRLPMVKKPLIIAYGTAELPPLVDDSREIALPSRRRASARRADPGGRRQPLHHPARSCAMPTAS